MSDSTLSSTFIHNPALRGVQTLEPVAAPTNIALQTRLLAGMKRLLAPRRPHAGLPEWIAFTVFCGILAYVIPKHETWFDEAQAWLIARDSSLPDLLIHRLHYEGSPGLWHVLLWIEWRLHVSLLGMHFIAGAIAAAGVAVWLRFNPLPRIVSLLVPFGFFLQYQYAVIARSYVLCPLLAFILMAFYAERRSSPIWFCIVAGLLANGSLHMAALSAGLVLLYLHDRRSARTTAKRRNNKLSLLAYAVLVFLFAAAIATALPTADGSSTTANPIVSGIRSFLSPAHGARTVHPLSTEPESLPETQPPQQDAFGLFLWHAIHAAPDASPRRKFLAACVKHLVVLLTAITVPISTSNIFSIAYLLLFAITAYRVGCLLSLVPYVFVQLCNVLISGEAHHLGLLWIALLCSLWAMAARPVPVKSNAIDWLALLFAATVVVAIWQMSWSWHAIRSDVAEPYASSEAAAEFLAHLPAGTRVAAFDDDSVTVNAYLPRRPYFNQQVDYWPFSRTRDADVFLAATMAKHPDVVMVKMASPVSPVMDQWVTLIPQGTEITQPSLEVVRAYGYRETERFCGKRFFRNTAESTDCRLVFRPVALTSNSPLVVRSTK